MKSVSGKGFARILARYGWTLLRIQGSHHIYGKPEVRTKLSEPIRGNRGLKPGLQRYFMRAAGLTDTDLQ